MTLEMTLEILEMTLEKFDKKFSEKRPKEMSDTENELPF
jgi:hypothetical protein